MDNQRCIAGFGECPNCHYIGKLREEEKSVASRMTGGDFLVGCILLLAGGVFGILWFIWCLAVRKKKEHYSCCTRCGYNYIIPLTENEYLEKIKTTEAQ